MKKLLTPALCALVGCVAGVSFPAAIAQPPRQLERWEQFCDYETARAGTRDSEWAAHNRRLRQRGAAGWQLVGFTGGNGRNSPYVPCYVRHLR